MAEFDPDAGAAKAGGVIASAVNAPAVHAGSANPGAANPGAANPDGGSGAAAKAGPPGTGPAIDVLASAALATAQPLDLLATRFALSTVLTLGPRFNLKRDVNNIVALTGRYLCWPVTTLGRLQAFLGRRCAESPAWAGVAGLAPAAFLERHGSWNGPYDDVTLFYYLDEFVKLNGKDLLAAFQATVEACDRQLVGKLIRLEHNVGLLGRVLDLGETEGVVLLHASLCKYQRELRPVLVDCKAASAQEAYAMLAQVLGCPVGEIAACLRVGGRLEALGLIDTPLAEHVITDLGDLMRVSDKLLSVLTAEYRSEAEMMSAFTRPAGESELTIADFVHVEADARYLTALLKAASEGQERGINVLIYGPPGTGKTEFAKVLSRQAGCELYAVDCLDREGNSLSGKERYRSLQVSQAFLKERPATAILFDEVEDVFPPFHEKPVQAFGLEEARGLAVNGKAWVNQTLEQNPVPTIWISNAIGQIDPAYRRRFQFHLELTNPPPQARERILRKHLEGLEVSETFIASVARRKQVTPAQIQSASRFARLTRGRLDEGLEALIDHQLDRADKALGHRDEAPRRPMPTSYDLGLLNVESRFPVDRIIVALEARPRATLCFYGLPGTGKTALAEHIADRLERPLMIRRASDLMSKYVGETEQKMSRMFSDATDDGAILLLDEADSFLQNRQLAVRNYEVTEVNEMLQGMERFDGIFICTTNLLDRIDEAALRRFSFKLRFLPLRHEDRERMFVAEALAGDGSRMTEAIRRLLSSLECLTPGDFAAVVRQYQLLAEAIDPGEFAEQLEREHRAKPDVRFSRSVGFLR